MQVEAMDPFSKHHGNVVTVEQQGRNKALMNLNGKGMDVVEVWPRTCYKYGQSIRIQTRMAIGLNNDRRAWQILGLRLCVHAE